MNFPLVSVVLSLFVVSQLRVNKVVAESTEQGQETGVVVDRAFFGNSLGTAGKDRERLRRDLQTASSGAAGKYRNDRVRRWSDEDEFLAAAEMNSDELRQAGSSRKRGFDSLGGGMIPLKRRFDSLGGGIIPTRKRGSEWEKEALENLAIGVKSRRRFDSIGGGYIPFKRRFDSLGGGMIPPKKH